MVAGKGSDPIRTEELILIEHARQDPAQPLLNSPAPQCRVPRTPDAPSRLHECCCATRACAPCVRSRMFIIRRTRSRCHMAAGILQKAGMIDYARGVVTIKDRPMLEESACECYAIVRDEFQKLSLL